MDWQGALRALRPQLPRAREPWGVRGSLRWLEEAMRARGASPSSVRNIVYRDIGTPADKRVLHTLFYLNAAQPWRTVMFFIGQITQLGIMVQLLMKAF